jgi:hypothetical protein
VGAVDGPLLTLARTLGATDLTGIATTGYTRSATVKDPKAPSSP